MAHIIFSEGSNLQNTIYGKCQEPVKMFLEKRAESFEQESIMKEIFGVQSSTHWAEKFASMTGMEGFKPVGENGAYPTDGMQESYSKTLENVTWKNSFAISREIIDDSNMIDLKQKPQAFITGYYRTRERFAACLMGGAITATAKPKFEGVEFSTIGADESPETANNGFNYQFGRWNVIVWPYLNQFITSGTAPWILMDSRYNKDYGSAIWLDRVKLEVKSKIAENDANVWKGYARFTAGFNDWRAFAVGGIAGATALIS